MVQNARSDNFKGIKYTDVKITLRLYFYTEYYLDGTSGGENDSSKLRSKLAQLFQQRTLLRYHTHA